MRHTLPHVFSTNTSFSFPLHARNHSPEPLLRDEILYCHPPSALPCSDAHNAWNLHILNMKVRDVKFQAGRWLMLASRLLTCFRIKCASLIILSFRNWETIVSHTRLRHGFGWSSVDDGGQLPIFLVNSCQIGFRFRLQKLWRSRVYYNLH